LLPVHAHVQLQRLANLAAMVSTGLREVIGSWKIMAILLPRTLPNSRQILTRSQFIKEHLPTDDLARR